MKKYVLKKISFHLAFMLVLFSVLADYPAKNAYATQSRKDNFNKTYTLTGNAADDIVSVALAQAGRTKASLGYTEAWCADFVSDCAELAGASAAIPFYGGCTGLRQRILDAGGTVVATPQKGDLVFYYCKKEGNYAHVGIMKSQTHSIQGNVNGIVYDNITMTGAYTYRDAHNDASPTYVRPKYGTTPGNVSFSSYSVGSITQTNAVPKCSISYSGARPSEVGLYFGTSQGNMRKVASDKITHNKNPFEVWYELSTEAHLTLSASTKYYYQFYAIKDGTESKSDVNSFTTKGGDVSFYNFSLSGLTKNNAVPRCSISYSGSRPSSVGIYVGTSTQNMRKVASDTINHNKNPFDAWYNLKKEAGMTLKKNTKYYFKFYAIVNGAEYGSGIKYFVTKK